MSGKLSRIKLTTLFFCIPGFTTRWQYKTGNIVGGDCLPVSDDEVRIKQKKKTEASALIDEV